MKPNLVTPGVLAGGSRARRYLPEELSLTESFVTHGPRYCKALGSRTFYTLVGLVGIICRRDDAYFEYWRSEYMSQLFLINVERLHTACWICHICLDPTDHLRA